MLSEAAFVGSVFVPHWSLIIPAQLIAVTCWPCVTYGHVTNPELLKSSAQQAKSLGLVRPKYGKGLAIVRIPGFISLFAAISEIDDPP